MNRKDYRPATLLVHQGKDRDPATGAATVPIYQASTYHHEGGTAGEYDYARSGNPSREQVEEAIDDLPIEYKMVVVLSMVEDFSYKEIADILNCPIGTVMSRLHRGRKLLQKRLIEYAREKGYLKGDGHHGTAG